MIHKPIHIKNLSLSFPHKTCFEDFNVQIGYGNHIAIIGRNGSGKSSLLKMLQDMLPDDVICGYVPQIIEEFATHSGGERLNEAITRSLALNPNLLLLDEPTNHLDERNRKNLIRMLHKFPGTLIIVSHDKEVLRNLTESIWHINDGKIHIFSGNYDDYMNEINIRRASISQEIVRLDRQKKDNHQALMKEQKRASKSKIKGEKSIDQRKWPTIVSKAKALRAENTSGKKKAAIDQKKQGLIESISVLRLPEIIIPKFTLKSADTVNRLLISISNGSGGYAGSDHMVLQNINFSLSSNDRYAIKGNNGSGKSTFVKAILGDPNILKTGSWQVPNREDIGYLDQQYENLKGHSHGSDLTELSVISFIQNLVPGWAREEVRKHLNDFLFRKNEEVNAPISQLSGGEKARLSLAGIAAKTPKLLILDEITNNLDLETKKHVIEVLSIYPGAMIVISHEEDFLQEIKVEDSYKLSS